MDWKWVTVDEFAERIGVSKRTIQRWWAQDKIEVVKLSYKRLVIRPDEAERVASEYKARLESRIARINGDA